ncbi:hypothetical protein [Kitasatospora viridis]|uniref:Uncharacterized protein n=1 Tax=Kitasatospora viridis TaxID=281105 RepID=A0A561UKK5_9ACTN|nr:hypothetical protein [Kitasatospora viridis]TWF99898.1 hypothetical protein FHX73_113758 [Kitasatospora viridis]
MPDALPIPPDLVQLQRTRIAAETAVAEYISRVDAQRRELHPDPEQALERAAWSEDESAELGRLRAERDEFGRAVRQHPVLVQAREQGVLWPTWDALQDATRASAS